jgi:branched-chain amino acid transport system substrate-binding protein
MMIFLPPRRKPHLPQARTLVSGARAFALGSFMLCGAGLVSAAQADFAPYTKVIGIAVVAPLSGPQRQYGLDLSAGVGLAVDEANQARGLTDYGWAVHSYDDQADAGEALQQAQFATIDDATSFVIGHVGASETLSALPAYQQAKIPLIVPGAGLAALTQKGYDNVFRLCPSDVTEGSQDARYAERTLKARRVAVVYEENDYGADAAQGFMSYAAARKQLGAKDYSVDVELKRLTDVASSVKSYAPDLVFLAGSTPDMLRTVAALRAAGVSAPLLATQSFYSSDVLSKSAGQLAGLTVSSCLPPIEMMPQAQPFVRRYSTAHGQLSAYALLGYVAAQVAIDAARQARTADRRALVRQLAVGNFPTVLGNISFQRNGDAQQDNFYFYTLDKAAFKYAGALYPNPLVCDPAHCR